MADIEQRLLMLIDDEPAQSRLITALAAKAETPKVRANSGMAGITMPKPSATQKAIAANTPTSGGSPRNSGVRRATRPHDEVRSVTARTYRVPRAPRCSPGRAGRVPWLSSCHRPKLDAGVHLALEPVPPGISLDAGGHLIRDQKRGVKSMEHPRRPLFGRPWA